MAHDEFDDMRDYVDNGDFFSAAQLLGQKMKERVDEDGLDLDDDAIDQIVDGLEGELR